MDQAKRTAYVKIISANSLTGAELVYADLPEAAI